MSYLVSFCSCIFQSFCIAITLFGEERANLSAFRTFVRFVLVWICQFPLPLGVWEGLRFVIVALPGLFSYLFFIERGRLLTIRLLTHIRVIKLLNWCQNLKGSVVWLGCGKKNTQKNRHMSGNNHIVGIDNVMMSPIELLNPCHAD